MKTVEIKINSNSNKNNLFSTFYNYIYLNGHSILIALNIIISLYLLIQNYKNNILIKELLKVNSENITNKLINNTDLNPLNYTKEIIDIDMIGLKYPEIDFGKFKSDLNYGKFLSSF